MTRCEQQKNEMIPAAAGELVDQGGVAKFGEAEGTSSQNRPENRACSSAGHH
jgi:hypothetical protein